MSILLWSTSTATSLESCCFIWHSPMTVETKLCTVFSMLSAIILISSCFMTLICNFRLTYVQASSNSPQHIADTFKAKTIGCSYYSWNQSHSRCSKPNTWRNLSRSDSISTMYSIPLSLSLISHCFRSDIYMLCNP